jgi:hypothetical protein
MTEEDMIDGDEVASKDGKDMFSGNEVSDDDASL